MLRKALLISAFLPASLAFAVAMTDPQITSVVMTADSSEIDASTLALSRAKSEDVKTFAKMMITEHTRNQSEAKSLAKKASLKPATNPASEALKHDSAEKVASLKTLTGADFDKAFMDMEVKAHQQLLAELDEKLIPNAADKALKSFLEATKLHAQEHLTRAQTVQAALAKK